MAPIVEAGSNELIGVIQIINNKAGVPFGALAEEGVSELAQTLAIAFKQRQKPQLAKTKYDYLIADAVLSAGDAQAPVVRGAPLEVFRAWSWRGFLSWSFRWGWRLFWLYNLALLVFSPVLVWNAAHGWASIAKQGGRAGADAPGITFRFLGELIAGQVGVASPIIFVLCVAGVAAASRAWGRRGDQGAALLAAMVLPGAAIFLWQATGSRVQANWTARTAPSVTVACPGRTSNRRYSSPYRSRAASAPI